jgi:gamma-glutamylcyclotransferase (GGCT)/AIG2-like uncharacterized protein YtfP
MIRKLNRENRIYFAYGEDMHPDVIGDHCAAPFLAGTARLEGFRLDFFGHTKRWDGGAETLVRDPREHVWGALYTLDFGDAELLDEFWDTRLDGTGTHYHLPVEVALADGTHTTALTYVLSQRGRYRPPSAEDVNLIAEAGRLLGFDRQYCERLQSQPCGPASYPVPRDSKHGPAECGSCGDLREEMRETASA